MVFLLDVSPFKDKAVFDRFFVSCKEYRKNKISHLAVEDDRIRSLGAEVLLAFGMMDCDNPDYDIAVSETGKPYDKNSDTHFNLSHSGMFAAAAFDECDVGIDIEVPRAVDLKLAERIFSPEENVLIKSSPAPEKQFLRIWTRKEALIKAYGKTLSCKLTELNTVCDNVEIDSASYGITTIEDENYFLSVARKGEPKPILCENIMVM